MPDFDAQPTLIGPSLLLRPLEPNDFEKLYAAAADPEVWAGHPVKDRHTREVFEPYFDFLLASGTTLAILDRASDKVIGCSRYYPVPDQPEDVGIGFTFLNNAYWGGGTNFQLKRLMLEHALDAFATVWFHIGPTNIRSQKATAKLGAVHVYDAELDLAGSPAAWMCFRLDKAAWEGVRDAADTLHFLQGETPV